MKVEVGEGDTYMCLEIRPEEVVLEIVGGEGFAEVVTVTGLDYVKLMDALYEFFEPKGHREHA